MMHIAACQFGRQVLWIRGGKDSGVLGYGLNQRLIHWLFGHSRWRDHSDLPAKPRQVTGETEHAKCRHGRGGREMICDEQQPPRSPHDWAGGRRIGRKGMGTAIFGKWKNH